MVVDASVWVSGLVEEDAHHQDVRRWLGDRLAHGDTLTIPTLALVEVAGSVARRLKSEAVGRRSMERLLAVPGLRLVPLDAGLAEHAARLAAALGLRGADAVYVAVAERQFLPLVTLDAEISRRAGGVVIVTQP